MKCPRCGGDTVVQQVRGGRRRRKCVAAVCAYQFHTEEREVPAFANGGDRRSEAFKEARNGGPVQQPL